MRKKDTVESISLTTLAAKKDTAQSDGVNDGVNDGVSDDVS